jgi:hypothetical protein
MAYNCDTFKVKRLENLLIPINAFYNINYHNLSWLPEPPVILDIETDEIEIDYSNQTVTGFRQGDNILVKKLEMEGEGSGTVMGYFEETLKQSTGYLEAVRVWEGGDTIDRLVVDNGVVTTSEVDL